MIDIRWDRIRTDTDAILTHWYETSYIGSFCGLITVSTKIQVALIKCSKKLNALHEQIKSWVELIWIRKIRKLLCFFKGELLRNIAQFLNYFVASCPWFLYWLLKAHQSLEALKYMPRYRNLTNVSVRQPIGPPTLQPLHSLGEVIKGQETLNCNQNTLFFTANHERY